MTSASVRLLSANSSGSDSPARAAMTHSDSPGWTMTVMAPVSSGVGETQVKGSVGRAVGVSMVGVGMGIGVGSVCARTAAPPSSVPPSSQAASHLDTLMPNRSLPLLARWQDERVAGRRAVAAG